MKLSYDFTIDDWLILRALCAARYRALADPIIDTYFFTWYTVCDVTLHARAHFFLCRFWQAWRIFRNEGPPPPEIWAAASRQDFRLAEIFRLFLEIQFAAGKISGGVSGGAAGNFQPRTTSPPETPPEIGRYSISGFWAPQH